MHTFIFKETSRLQYNTLLGFQQYDINMAKQPGSYGFLLLLLWKWKRLMFYYKTIQWPSIIMPFHNTLLCHKANKTWFTVSHHCPDALFVYTYIKVTLLAYFHHIIIWHMNINIIVNKTLFITLYHGQVQIEWKFCLFIQLGHH